MAITETPPEVTGAGEYGATTVVVTKDGGSTRIAFGRNGAGGGKTFFGAIILSPEALIELKDQLAALEK